MKTTAILMDDEVAVKIEEWAAELNIKEDELAEKLFVSMMEKYGRCSSTYRDLVAFAST